MDELSKLADDRRQGRLPGPARKKGIASNEMCTDDSGKCNRVPEPVREREPCGNRGAGDCGDGGKHGSGGGVL